MVNRYIHVLLTGSLNHCHIHGGNLGDAYRNYKYALCSGNATSAVYPKDSSTHSRVTEDWNLNKIFDRGTN